MSIDHWARVTPDAPALIMAGSGEATSYRELDRRSNQAAHLFRSLGLHAGDHCAFMVENSPLFFVLCWGALRSGLIYTPLSTYLAAEDAAYVVSDCDAKMLVTTAKYRDLADAILQRSPQLHHRFMAGGVTEGFAALEEALEAMPGTPIADQQIGADMNYSSGTTGRPKGVERKLPDLPFGVPQAADERLAARFKFSSASRFLVPNPLYHSAPMRHSLLVHTLGGCVVPMERFDAEAVLRSVDAYRITHALFVPTMFVRLLRLPEAVRRSYSTASLQLATHVAAPCPIPVKEAMINWWGPIITELYGNTEECGFASITTAEWREHKGSIGKPTIGRVHVLDDLGEELAAGAPGLIWVEGGRPFSYYKDPEKTAESRNARGWQTVGDNGYLDVDGYVYLTDRNAFTINSGGVKVAPKEVEDALCAHPAVHDAAVFGLPDPEFGEQVKAIVQLEEGGQPSDTLETELIEHCRTILSRIKVPKSITFEPVLPRNEIGKLMKKPLREKYLASLPV